MGGMPRQSNDARSTKRRKSGATTSRLDALQKCPTGIRGFDEVTDGGLPRGRPALICGGPGCGKTVLSMEFLVRGAVEFGEPGVFMSFEEPADDLRKNMATLGFDIGGLIDDKKLVIDHVRVERSEIEETGEYDLEGLFIRLGYAIDTIGARRVVLDTIESLFAGLSNSSILRAEMRRLFGWLKSKGVTAVITGERGEGALTRQGLEEYVSDCVILLDQRLSNGLALRRLRVVKYRGSSHGSNEYPFLIDQRGISVIPITSLGLDHRVSDERVSSGVPALDEMLGGAGYYRGSSVLVSGTAGSGKSSLAAHFAEATCRRGERCLYFAFEESQPQIQRNMRSIGLDLGRYVASGLLRFHNARPTVYGIEMHLATMHGLIRAFSPQSVVIDPVTNLMQGGQVDEVHSMLLRLVDFLKVKGITAFVTSLTESGVDAEGTSVDVSSLMDTWLLLRNIEVAGERNRGLYVLKSRGMAHSNQIREFVLTDHGVDLLEVYKGPTGVFVGSARIAQEAMDAADDAARQSEIEARGRRFEHRRAALTAQIAALEAEIAQSADELETERHREVARRRQSDATRARVAQFRGAAAPGAPLQESTPPRPPRKRNGRQENRP
jgi:circadian clock protein KaiC